MKKSLAVLVAGALVFGSLGAPSAVAKKKKKTKTITFEAEGSMAIPNPSTIAIGGITESEFTSVHECGAMPTSQGVDGFVIEVPEEYRSGTAMVNVAGSDTTGQYDMDVYFYDAGCSLMEPYMTDGVDPAGYIPPGAAWAVVDLWVGANASFTFTAKATVPARP